MMPLYGFLEGDTIGLLILAYKTDRICDLAAKLQQSARVRVAVIPSVRVIYKGRELAAELTVEQAGIEALERIDVVRNEI